MGIKLSKFPVTAPDGTEYRVTIKELSNEFGSEGVRLKVYTKRKLFGYRKVYQCLIRDSFFTAYNSSNPDFVNLAKIAVKWHLHDEEARVKEIASKLKAVQRFKEWDGKITEVAE